MKLKEWEKEKNEYLFVQKSKEKKTDRIYKERRFKYEATTTAHT